MSENNKIQPYNTKQLAALYGINPDTFRKWIKPFKKQIGERTGQIYTPKQVSVIFEHLGEP